MSNIQDTQQETAPIASTDLTTSTTPTNSDAMAALSSQVTALTQNQASTMTQLNESIASEQSGALCTSNDNYANCSTDQRTNLLYDTYTNAQLALQNAQPNFNKAEKDYYVSIYGETGYIDRIVKPVVKEAVDKNIAEINTNFEKEFGMTANLIDIYEQAAVLTTKIPSTPTDILINQQQNQHENQNIEGFTTLMDDFNETVDELKDYYKTYYPKNISNFRKSYYESNAIQKLQKWQSIFFKVYFGLLVLWVLGVIFITKQISIGKVGLFVALCIYPFLAEPIAHGIYKSLVHIYDNLPRNVYLNM